MPIIILMSSITFWAIYGKMKNLNVEKVLGDLASTVIILLFLIHP